MTIERAIKVLKDMVPKTCKMVNGRYVGGFEDTECPQFEAIQVAVNAFEKQIPRRAKLYKHNGDFKWENYPCPYCGEMLGLEINKRYVKFCPNCGQALDWGDSE